MVVQPFQCTGTSFTFRRGYWSFTSNLQKNIYIAAAAVTGGPYSAHSVHGRNEFIQSIVFFSAPFVVDDQALPRSHVSS